MTDYPPRAALFDLAVNRSLVYLQKLGVPPPDASAEVLQGKLELWYLKTRFAYRVALPDIIRVLKTFPGAGHFWQGGPDGSWRAGEPPTP